MYHLSLEAVYFADVYLHPHHHSVPSVPPYLLYYDNLIIQLLKKFRIFFSAQTEIKNIFQSIF